MKILLWLTLIASVKQVYAEPLKALDTGANARLLDTYFGRYGFRPASVILRESNGIRFRMNGTITSTKPTGIYSFFALAGNFQLNTDYEIIEIQPPTSGYGSAIGLTLETKGTEGELAIRRGVWEKEGHGVQVLRGIPDPNGTMTYTASFYPTQSKKGRLAIRRSQAEITILTADDLRTEPRELTRVHFTNKTIRTLLIFFDTGGSPTRVDARFKNLTIQSDELTGGIPERESQEHSWMMFMIILISTSTTGAICYWKLRRKYR